MTDREKLLKLAELVDEMRRLHKVTRKPPNSHERREIEKQEAEVDFFIAQVLDAQADADTLLAPPTA